jgi:hypothetical protein
MEIKPGEIRGPDKLLCCRLAYWLFDFITTKGGVQSNFGKETPHSLLTYPNLVLYWEKFTG